LASVSIRSSSSFTHNSTSPDIHQQFIKQPVLNNHKCVSKKQTFHTGEGGDGGGAVETVCNIITTFPMDSTYVLLIMDTPGGSTAYNFRKPSLS